MEATEESASLNHDPNDTCVICSSRMEDHSYYRFDCGHKMHKWCYRGCYFFHYDIEDNCLRCPTCSANITELTHFPEYHTPVKRCIFYLSPILLFSVVFTVVFVTLKHFRNDSA